MLLKNKKDRLSLQKFLIKFLKRNSKSSKIDKKFFTRTQIKL